ncbi:MAG TPA: DNA primase [Micromonosporaceae bacterium]|nr:DNA primase [Micromonosporaceae bacterium]
MARPPAGRPSADEPDPTDDESVPIDEDDEAADELDDEDDVDEDEEELDDEPEDEEAVDDEESEEPLTATPRRTSTAEHFWQRVRVDPVEVALPAGVGYTLRAYRQNTDITPADVSDREQDVALPTRRAYVEAADLDDSDLDGRAGRRDKREADEDEDNLDEYEDELAADDDELEDEDDHDDDEAAMVEEDVVEEVPVFLSHRGHLLVFRSAESLVDFVLSDAEHDLQQIDTWESVSRGIRPEYVVASSDDTYELDLVVKNLRGGQDVWDPPLLIRAGQFARDLSHALRVEPVMLALAPGAPLDELDEALRVVADGGLSGFFARRRLKKVGAESASLGWRTVIGKISAVVDWRD